MDDYCTKCGQIQQLDKIEGTCEVQSYKEDRKDQANKVAKSTALHLLSIIINIVVIIKISASLC